MVLGLFKKKKEPDFGAELDSGLNLGLNQNPTQFNTDSGLNPNAPSQDFNQPSNFSGNLSTLNQQNYSQ